MSIADFTKEDIAAIARAEPPPESAQFDHEVDDRDAMPPADRVSAVLKQDD